MYKLQHPFIQRSRTYGTGGVLPCVVVLEDAYVFTAKGDCTLDTVNSAIFDEHGNSSKELIRDVITREFRLLRLEFPVLSIVTLISQSLGDILGVEGKISYRLGGHVILSIMCSKIQCRSSRIHQTTGLLLPDEEGTVAGVSFIVPKRVNSTVGLL